MVLSIILVFPAHQNPIESTILGIGITIVFQLIDIQRRRGTSKEQILQATAWSQALSQDEWLFKYIQHIVSDYLSVKSGSFKLFQNRADDLIVECRKILQGMEDGYLVAPSQSSYTYSRKAFEKAEEGSFVWATSIGDINYWRTSFAEKYLQQNAAARKRGVDVKRIFIRPKTELQEAVDILEKHRVAEVEVYVIEPENVPPELNEDFLIMGTDVTIRVEFGNDGKAHFERISINKMDVERATEKFEELLRMARPLDKL